MNNITTITQKGQIVIPAAIRKHMNLKPTMRFKVELQNDSIIVQPIMTTDQARGMIQSNRPLSRNEEKKIIRNRVVKKIL